MRLIFGTDLHGNEHRYERLGQAATEHKADVLVVGGDLAPKFVDDIFSEQANFYGWMRRWADQQTVPVYTYLGNDDLKALLPEFLGACEQSDNLNVLEAEGEMEGFRYMRYNNVPDTPFGLKDWCRYDHKGYVPERYAGRPVVSVDTGDFSIIDDPVAYFGALLTIEEELSKFRGHFDLAFIHTPPAGLSLDVCWDGRHVGSRAVYEWLRDNAPLISFHGHIHESYQKTGIWYNYLQTPSREIVVTQPGDKNFVVADIEKVTQFVGDVTVDLVRY